MSDQLTIQNGKVVLVTEEGQQVERTETQLLDMLRGEFLPPLKDAALPDGVKFLDWRPPMLLVVHQMPPHVRQFRWIADDSPVRFGPGTVYRKVRLSIPYAITFALYAQQGERLFLFGSNELYFRNEPLRTRSDRLGYPALLNISRIALPKRERAWICTQYLHWSPESDWTGQLQALLEHTWNGGFNLSSEDHEGASWFGASKGIHRDLYPVEKWEKASAANDAFGLSVPWKPVPLSVAEIIDCLFEENQPMVAHLTGARPTKRKKSPSLVGRFMNFVLKG
ncbi:MAG TPA: hypothetical protein VH643_22000 [Gemmataceae bacterium]|jgi:hypothetical protein